MLMPDRVDDVVADGDVLPNLQLFLLFWAVLGGPPLRSADVGEKCAHQRWGRTGREGPGSGGERKVGLALRRPG